MNLKDLEITREQAAVISSGIVSMGLQILAGRVLAPEFGSTVYTWGSIIGVSMVALSLGYHHGGKTAERTTPGHLDQFLVYTAGYMLLLIFAADAIISFGASLPIGARYASLIPVTVLFGPPTYFLGYISPYAVQLSSRDVKGEASGHFYAVGTAGSILGAFGTTFFLIPHLQIEYIYVLFAAIAVAPLARSLKDPKILLIPLFVVIGILLSGASLSTPGEVVYQEDTRYQELRITDSEHIRTMYLDGQPQSAVYLNGSDGYVYNYLEYFHIPLLLNPDAEKVLFIGGGGFVGPQKFAEMGMDVDAVELDPAVVEAAQNYFNLSENSNLSIFEADGREFLQNTEKEYDAVYVDAFRKSSVPFHLTTEEFADLLHEKTAEDGVIHYNVISTAEGPGSRYARAQYKTLNQVFRSTYYFPTEERMTAQNIQIIADKQEKLSEEELKELDERNTREDISPFLEYINPEIEEVPVLKDDYAPVSRLTEPLLGKTYHPVETGASGSSSQSTK